jgi:hypothetical protein
MGLGVLHLVLGSYYGDYIEEWFQKVISWSTSKVSSLSLILKKFETMSSFLTQDFHLKVPCLEYVSSPVLDQFLSLLCKLLHGKSIYTRGVLYYIIKFSFQFV